MLRTLRTNIQTLGWWNGVLYLLGTALSRTSADRLRIVKYELVSQPITTAPLLPAHRGKTIQVREARADDPLLQCVADRREGVFAERFARGARCLVAELNGELAGFLWFVKGDYPEDEVRCLFRPLPEGQSVWDYDVYVAKQHRLSPVFLKLWQAANERLHAEGIHHSASRISAFNAASWGSHERLGARKAGWALFVCVGSWQIMAASRKPFVHLSFSRQSRPVLQVGPGKITSRDNDSR